jgi:hypothetical protein
MGCKQNSANVTFTLGAGSSASPFFGMVNLSQRLCAPVCSNDIPLFTPKFTLESFSSVGTGQYVATISMEGVINYSSSGNDCCARMMIVKQSFTIPFVSATEPTSVTITSGITVNAVNTPACQNYSRDFVSETPITITIA